MSWLLGDSGVRERFYPGSQGLGDYENDEFSYSCQSVYSPKKFKSYGSSSGSQVEDLGESTPFSLNPGHSYIAEDEVKNTVYGTMLAKHALELEEEAQKFEEPFYKGTGMPGSKSEDECYSWASHLPMHQRFHVPPAANMALCDSYDSYQRSVGNHSRMDGSEPYLGHPEYTGGAEPHIVYEEDMRNRDIPSLQLTNDILREDNIKLKTKLRNMRRYLEIQACQMGRLEKELKDSLAREEREAQKLQYFVQQTERNLQMMTQRALEAESKVEKLKQEISIILEELESSKAENEKLRASQMINPGVAKHSIDLALQSLSKIIMGAGWSIKQLTSGVQSLNFVAELLKSAGKISEAEAEEKE